MPGNKLYPAIDNHTPTHPTVSFCLLMVHGTVLLAEVCIPQTQGVTLADPLSQSFCLHTPILCYNISKWDLHSSIFPFMLSRKPISLQPIVREERDHYTHIHVFVHCLTLSHLQAITMLYDSVNFPVE
jgi:hypothetical protein